MFGEKTKLPKSSNANNADVGFLVAGLLTAGFAASYFLLGQWEAVRGFAVEAAILAVTFYIARQWLPWEDAPRPRVQQPRVELLIAIFGFLFFYVGWPYFSRVDTAEGLFFNSMFANALIGLMAAVALLVFRSPRESWGLRMPTGRELAVLAVVAAMSIGISSLVGGLLPPTETMELVGPVRPFLPGSLMWAIYGTVSSGTDALPILLLTFIVSVIGQELFFRVYLQTRLAQFWPGRWALFVQAVAYLLAGFLPFYFLTGGNLTFTFLLTQAAVLSNGILAGYFWRKTGSLPLLILLHILAFSRWGL